MRTSELIAALAADPVPEPIRLGRRIAAALAIGFAASLAIFALLLGPRPDIAAGVNSARFWLKLIDSFAFALPSILLTLRLARPDAKPRALALWLIAPFVLLAAGVVVELMVVPQSEWLSRLVGDERHALHGDDSDARRSHPGGAHRRAALRRASAPGVDRGAGRRGLRRRRSADLRAVLPRQFAAVRGDLVSARHPHLHGRGRDCGPAISGLVRRTVGRYFLTNGSRIALSWSMLSSPP